MDLKPGWSMHFIVIAFLLVTAYGHENHSSNTSITGGTSIIGEWQDEDQLILISENDPYIDPLKIITGFDLNVEKQIKKIENQLGTSVVD